MYSFKIIQDKIVVVRGYCPDLEAATAEAQHYKELYEQDGPVTVVIKRIKDK